jgi:hypothetical protein
MPSKKIDLTLDEMKIIIELIHALNFKGTDVEKVGLLVNKLRTEIQKIEKEPKTNEQ